MAKGDDLWGDEPALGRQDTVDDQPTSGSAAEPSAVNEPDDASQDNAPAAEAPSERSALDHEADRIDLMGRTDLAKKQAFELTAIRILLQRLSARLDTADDKESPDKPTDAS